MLEEARIGPGGIAALGGGVGKEDAVEGGSREISCRPAPAVGEAIAPVNGTKAISVPEAGARAASGGGRRGSVVGGRDIVI
jgi:hypothetical protein